METGAGPGPAGARSGSARVQLAPNHVPPDWPDGGPQQIHLDLWVDDIDAAHEEVMALGATLLKPAETEPDVHDSFQVYADPAGHPFCLCWVLTNPITKIRAGARAFRMRGHWRA